MNRRECRQPYKYQALAAQVFEPSSYEKVSDQQFWKDAMMEEYQSIMKNDVWEIVSRLEGNSVVTSKWIYTFKHAIDGNIEKQKVRLMARVFSQKEGDDYEETFALVTKYTSIKVIIFLSSIIGWRLHYMVVKAVFLNDVIEEEVYI